MTKKPKTKPKVRRITVDPADFTDTQWVEMFCAGGETVMLNDCKTSAKPFKATPEQLDDLITECRAKADRIEAGDLGIEGDEHEWAGTLRDAADKLTRISFGKEAVPNG